MAQPTQLYGWTTRQLEAIAGLMAPAWDAWCGAWGLEPSGPPLCRPFGPQDGAASWKLAASLGGRHAWLPEGACAHLGRALFALQGEHRDTVARVVARACLDDLRRMLADRLTLTAAAGVSAMDAAPAAGPWSGSATLALPLAGQQALQLVLDAQCVAALVPVKASAAAAQGARHADLVALETALAGQRLRLKVQLNECELDLGTLRGLHVGDVLPLAHQLDAPARVLGDGERHVCNAYLGRNGSRKAAELARGITMEEEKL